MAFLQSFVSQQLLFLFSKHLDIMSNVTDCGTGRTGLWLEYNFFSNQTARYMGQIEKKGNSLRVYMYFQNILHRADQITPKLLLKRVILH